MTTRKRIIRAAHNSDNPYVMIMRAIPQDKSLSWEARGILCYLLSQRDDWKLQVDDLKQNCGEHTVYRVLKELKKAGYIVQERHRNDKGKYVYGDYLVYEYPRRDFQDVDNPDVDNPNVENRDDLINSGSGINKKDSAPADAGAAGEPDLKLVQPDKPKRKKQEPKPRPANPVFDTMALMSYRIPKGTAIPKKAQGHIAGLTGAAREAWQSIFGEIDTDRLCKAIVVFYEREYDSKNLARVTNVAAFGGQFTGFLQRYKNNPNGATQHHNPLTGLKIITADTDERSA